MSKFKVRITRVETYDRDVEVDAENLDDALAKAEENEQDNEYAELFDCPDDVQTSFKDANGGGKDNEPSFIADHELDAVAAKFFGVKGTAEKVINDGVIHPVKVGKTNFVIDGEGQGYVSLCVTCEDTGDTLYPMFKATAENLKGMLVGCDRPNMGCNFSLADLFPKQKTFKMLFGEHSDGTGFVRIYGMCFNGEVTYEGR